MERILLEKGNRHSSSQNSGTNIIGLGKKKQTNIPMKKELAKQLLFPHTLLCSSIVIVIILSIVHSSKKFSDFNSEHSSGYNASLFTFP